MRLSDVVVAEKLYNRVLATKRVSRCNLDLDGFKKLLRTIEAINFLEEDDEWFGQMNLKDINIPEQFIALIWPKAVRMFPSDKRSKDLIVRGNASSDVFDYDDMLNAMLSICSAYKVNEPVFKSIYDIRTVKSVSDAMKEAEVGDLGVNWDGARGFVPYNIIHLDVMKSSFFNSTADEVFDQWLREFPKLF